MSELPADVQAFRQYIRAERGLADNTLQAYGRDLDRFSMWAGVGGLADHLYPTLRELSNYVSFLRDQEKRRALYGDAYPIDEDFLAAVAAMPESAGIALGVDRLVMLASGATCIEDVLWLPVV